MPIINLLIQPDGSVVLTPQIQLGHDQNILWQRIPESLPFSLSFVPNNAINGLVFVSSLNSLSCKQEINTSIFPGFQGFTQIKMFTAAIQNSPGQTSLTNKDTDIVIRR